MPTPTLTPQAMRWLAAHHGIISTHQLRACGVAERTWKRATHDGLLVPVAKGVYRIASAPTTVEACCVVLSLAHPTGFVTGPTLARLLGLRRQPRDLRIHYSVPHGHELVLDDGVVLRQSRRVDPTLDIRERRDGIRIATAWRLAFDLAADLSAIDHRSVVEQMLHDRMCTVGQLAQTGKRLVAPRRPGSKRFLETLSQRLPGGPIESHPELEVAAALQARGVPIVAQQTWLDLPNGARARLDISVPDIFWGVEVDIHPTHFLFEGNAADRRRDRQCHLIGWQVERVTGLDLLDLDTTVDELLALYRRRCAELGRRSA